MGQQHDGGKAASGPSVPRSKVSIPDRLRDYLDLSKVDVPELWLGVPAAWSMLPPTLMFDRRTLLLGVMMLFGVMTVGAASQALDDVKGFEDGTDDTNYAPGRQRRRSRKPIIEGRLNARQAKRYSLGAGLVGVGLVFAIWAVADFRPIWLPFVTLVLAALAFQYSYGLSFSYSILAGGEAVLALTMAATTILASAVFTGQISSAAAIAGWLLGTGLLQVSVCGSTNDAPGDGQARRRTIAVMATPKVNRAFVLALIVHSIVVLVVATLISVLPWSLLPLAIPALWYQLSQIKAVRSDDWLRARRLGLLALRYLGLALIASGLIAGVV